MDLDPFRFRQRLEPEPVPGLLPPRVRLLEDDDELIQLARRPVWMRLVAGLLAVGFFVFSVLFTAASMGRQSAITDAGDWRWQLEPEGAR